MEQFLVKYSNVPSGFLKDFYGIAKEEYDENQFLIDFDIVVKWLDVRKDHLKRLLEHHFEEKYDYVIEEIKIKNKNGKGANWVDSIYLTSDCFKSLCMLSQTAKAKDVRKYFLSIEKLVLKYNKYIQSELEKKIGIIKNNQKDKIDIKSGVIYIIEAQNKEDSLLKYKIGKTHDVKSRLSTYNTQNANDVDPLFIIEVDDINQVEKCVKNLLKKYEYRKRKEIYEVDLDIIKQACIMCETMSKSFINYIKQHKTTKEKLLMNKKFKQLRSTKNSLIMSFNKNL